MSFKHLAAFLLLSLSVAGCNLGGGAGAPKSSDYVQRRSTPSSLARFQSSAKLEEYLKEGIKKATTNASSYGYWYPVTSPLTAADGGASNGSTSSSSQQPPVYSTTNLQEAGVDEADLIKSDGSWLYVAVVNANLPVVMTAGVSAGGAGLASSGATGTVSASGGFQAGGGSASLIATPSPGTPSDDQAFLSRYANSIRLMRVSDALPSASEIAVIRPTDDGYYIKDFYLLTGRANGQPDTLAVTATTSGSPVRYWFSPWYWSGSSTGLYLVNVADPTASTVAKRITFDGDIISSRRIGETVYIVSRFTPEIPGYLLYPSTSADEANNATLLNAATLPSLLPSLTIDGTKIGPLVSAENCYLPPTPNDGISTPTIITITAVNLQTPDSPVSSCIIGDTETMYASTNSIYLATTRYSYTPLQVSPASGSAATSVMAVYPGPEVSTDIHKFSLSASPPVYCCSGTALGHLGWEQDKKSFRMGELNGNLNIVTSVGETWDSTSSTILTVMGEFAANGQTTLGQIGKIPNASRPETLGKRGEQLYAVRFAGTKAYLVTFLLTDPLYILDLSNPADPFIAGQLQTAGFSDYLQVVGDNQLLGIGKDAVADPTSSFGDGRGSWYQGLKLSLFDVSDPENPRETGKVVIGKRGTDSDALQDHRAITFLPATASQPARLAIPVMLDDTVPTSGFDTSQPWSYYDWTNTGLYLFELNSLSAGGTINLLGSMITQTSTATNSFDWVDGNSRSLIVNNSVHFAKGGKVWSGTWSATPNQTASQ